MVNSRFADKIRPTIACCSVVNERAKAAPKGGSIESELKAMTDFFKTSSQTILKLIQESGCPCVAGNDPSSWFAPPPATEDDVLIEFELDPPTMNLIETVLASHAPQFGPEEFTRWAVHIGLHAAALLWPEAEVREFLEEEDRRIRAWAERQGLLP